MKYRLITTFLILLSLTTTAQEYNCFRAGVNYQGMPGGELGYAHLTIHEKGQLGGSYCLYSSLGANFRTGTNNIYTLKAGFETSIPLLLFGIEATYLEDFNYRTVAFTPRAGISVYGVASLTYGYSLIADNPFPYVYNNQISLTVNGNRKLWKEFKAKPDDKNVNPSL